MEKSTQELPADLDLGARGGGRRCREGWRKRPQTLERPGEALGTGSETGARGSPCAVTWQEADLELRVGEGLRGHNIQTAGMAGLSGRREEQQLQSEDKVTGEELADSEWVPRKW